MSLRGSEIDGTHIGLYNDNFYVWSLYNGSIVKCATNTKLTLLDLNTSNNVEVIDFKNMPKHNYYGHEQIILKDEHTIFFYDEATSSIRVIKGR